MLVADLTTATEVEFSPFRGCQIDCVFQFRNRVPDFTDLENVVFRTAIRNGRDTTAARKGRTS